MSIDKIEGNSTLVMVLSSIMLSSSGVSIPSVRKIAMIFDAGVWGTAPDTDELLIIIGCKQ